jgi:CheY-like chemotaxis protein
MLRRLGYRVLTANNGKDGLDRMRVEAAAIDLLLTDMMMPGMNGPQLVLAARRLQPATRVLYMSGQHPSAQGGAHAIAAGDTFVAKPFTELALASAVREALGEARFG